MSAKKIARQITKWTATGILSIGAIISIGLLGYCGMLVFTPSIAYAWIAFALAGFVDGEVFLQNIANGIDNLKLLGKHGVDLLILQELDNELNKYRKLDLENKLNELNADAILTLEKNYLVKEYYEYKKYIAEQEDLRRPTAQARKRLHRIQKLFVARVLSAEAEKDQDYYVQAIYKSLSTFKRKIWYLRASIPVCIISGIASGFVTAAALNTALVGTFAALSVAVWPLAIVAGIAYAFLIYYTIADIVRNDSINKWKEKIITWFQQKDNELQPEPGENRISRAYIWRVTKYVFRVTAIGLSITALFALGFLATLATGGTWWFAAKEGALLLPKLTAVASNLISLSVIVASAATLIFVTRNSLITIKEFAKRFSHPHAECKKASDVSTTPLDSKQPTQNKAKTWVQVLNPFRIITTIIKTPFNFLIILGHIAAVGLTGDRVPGLNRAMTIASAVVGAASDGFVDAHYFIGHDKHTHSPFKQQHEHSHGLIANFILNVLLSPLLIAAACWDSAAAKIPLLDALKTYFGYVKLPNPLFKVVRFLFSPLLLAIACWDAIAMRKPLARTIVANFNEHHKEAEELPPSSLAYLKAEMMHRLDKQKEGSSHDKAKLIEDIKRSLIENNDYELTDHNNAILRQHSLFASSEKTLRVVKEVIASVKKGNK